MGVSFKRALRELESDDGSHVEQFYSNHPLRRSGAYRLMIAVLEQAFLDIHPRGTDTWHYRSIRQQAREWFTSDSQYGLYSFAGICNTTGFDVERTRARALEMLRNHDRVTIYRQEKPSARASARTKRETQADRAERKRARLRGQVPRADRDV